MKRRWQNSWRLAAVLLATAALGAAETRTMPSPGTVNYVEGQVALNGEGLTAKSAGTALLDVNQVLDTGQGKAEILLTPGVFLRLGDNSELKMISPSLADTKVQLVKGSAMLEVAEWLKENNLVVANNGATTTIEKNGLYAFNADQPSVSVLDGKAVVAEGDEHTSVKKDHQVLLNSGQRLKSTKFDKDAMESDSLYRWSKLRSQYLAQANVETARTVVVDGGFYGAGWYWNPYWNFYSFLPGSGILYSPFGWGFYSPAYIWRAPIGYGFGYYRYPARTMPRGEYGRGAPGRHLSPVVPRVHPNRPIAPRAPRVEVPRMAPSHNFAPHSGGGRSGGFGRR
ncbi:MAG TPA: FecR domain-containing protein [Bryobacteraceae bacterium]|nr:FecR domain-containing protein [Bryobacteraceae bacterium]